MDWEGMARRHAVIESVWSAWLGLQNSLCDIQFIHHLFSVCVPGSRSGSFGCGCTVLSLVRLLSIVCPPILIMGKVLKKAGDNWGHSHSSDPLLASPGLVSRASHFCYVPPLKLSLGPHSLLHSRSWVPHRNPAVLGFHAWLLCCLHHIYSSSLVLCLADHAHCPDTQGSTPCTSTVVPGSVKIIPG